MSEDRGKCNFQEENPASGLEPSAAAPSDSEGKGVEEGGWDDNNEKVM